MNLNKADKPKPSRCKNIQPKTVQIADPPITVWIGYMGQLVPRWSTWDINRRVFQYHILVSLEPCSDGPGACDRPSAFSTESKSLAVSQSNLGKGATPIPVDLNPMGDSRSPGSPLPRM